MLENTFLKFVADFMVLHPSRQQSSESPLWEHQI